MQPSAQGIASMFMGNPGALAARVDQDRKQSPMGIPDDLRQLMALNIVTTENDAAKRQQAMQQLQQMAPNGQPPTVADSVRQQAAQKLQARMVQEQQKAQAMQQMVRGLPAAGIPEGVPQPERQPQGIDEAPVEFGMAGGGIVAFQEGGKGKYETAYDRMNRENREEEARARREEAEREAAHAALLAQIPTGGPTVSGGERVDSSELERNVRNTMAALPGASATRAISGSAGSARGLLAAISGLLGMDRVNSPETAPAAPPAPVAPAVDTSAETEKLRRLAAVRSQPAPVVKDLRGAAQVVRAPAPPAMGAAEQALKAGAGAVGEQSAAQKALADALAQDPAERRRQEMEFYKQAVPGPDFTQRDAAIKALQEERGRLAEPKEGFAGLAEYLSQIAATPRGMSSFEAGAAGARNLQAVQEARAQKRFDLGMKIVEQEQGKIDATRAYALETYNVGKKEFDAIFNRQFEAAKAMVTDEREARKLAAEMTMKELEMKSRERIADKQIAAAQSRREELTPAQRAEIANKARTAVDAQAKTDIRLQMELRKNPGLRDMLVQRETDRLMAIAEGRTMATAPGAPSPGGTMSGWGKASVVTP